MKQVIFTQGHWEDLEDDVADRIWAKVLAYVTARAIENRLDEVCGPGSFVLE